MLLNRTQSLCPDPDPAHADAQHAAERLDEVLGPLEQLVQRSRYGRAICVHLYNLVKELVQANQQNG